METTQGSGRGRVLLSVFSFVLVLAYLALTPSACLPSHLVRTHNKKASIPAPLFQPLSRHRRPYSTRFSCSSPSLSLLHPNHQHAQALGCASQHQQQLSCSSLTSEPAALLSPTVSRSRVCGLKLKLASSSSFSPRRLPASSVPPSCSLQIFHCRREGSRLSDQRCGAVQRLTRW